MNNLFKNIFRHSGVHRHSHLQNADTGQTKSGPNNNYFLVLVQSEKHCNTQSLWNCLSKNWDEMVFFFQCAPLFFSLLYWLAGGIIVLAFAHFLFIFFFFMQFSTHHIKMIKHLEFQLLLSGHFSLAGDFNDNKSLDGSFAQILQTAI